MHTPSCDNHPERDAYGLTGNSVFACAQCLSEALAGVTQRQYLAECRERMLSEMSAADADAEGEE